MVPRATNVHAACPSARDATLLEVDDARRPVSPHDACHALRGHAHTDGDELSVLGLRPRDDRGAAGRIEGDARPFWHWGASLMKTADPAVGIPVTRLLVLASVRTAPAAVDETTCPHTSSGGAALETPASAQAVSAPATASHAATTPAIFRPLPMVQGCFAPGLADARSSWVSPNRCHSAPAPPGGATRCVCPGSGRSSWPSVPRLDARVPNPGPQHPGPLTAPVDRGL